MKLDSHNFDMESLYFILHYITTVKKSIDPFVLACITKQILHKFEKKTLYFNLHYITTTKKINHLLLRPWSSCKV